MSCPAHTDRSSTEIKAMQLSDARDLLFYFRSNCEPAELFVGVFFWCSLLNWCTLLMNLPLQIQESEYFAVLPYFRVTRHVQHSLLSLEQSWCFRALFVRLIGFYSSSPKFFFHPSNLPWVQRICPTTFQIKLRGFILNSNSKEVWIWSHLLCVKLIQCIEQEMHFRLSLQKEQHLQMAAQPVLANRHKDKISFPVLGYFWFKLHKVM